MLTPQVLSVVIGVSSFLGFLALLAYLYFLQQFRRVERSVREFIEGEGLFNADQVLRILEQFTDDRRRLEALKALTNYDAAKARAVLTKIKDNVDVTRLNQISVGYYRQFTGISALLFFVLAALALVYSLSGQPKPSPFPPVVPADCPTFGRPSGGPIPGCECGTASVSIIPWVADPGSLRTDVQGEVRGMVSQQIGIQFEATPLCRGQSIRASESYIDWGDGSGRETLGDILQGCREHVYKVDGSFDVRVRVSLECYDFGPSTCSKRCVADGYIKARISATRVSVEPGMLDVIKGTCKSYMNTLEESRHG